MKFVKRIPLFLIILICILSVTLYSFLQWEGFWERSIPRWVNPHLAGAKIKDLTITHQKFQWPPQVEFWDVKFVLLHEGIEYLFEIPEGRVTLAFEEQTTNKKIDIRLLGLRMTSTLLTLQNGQVTVAVTFLNEGKVDMNGTVKVDSLESNGYRLTEANTKIMGGFDQITLKGLQGDFYGGRLLGNIEIKPDKVVQYHADVNLEKIDFVQLRSANPEVFSKIQGFFNGKVLLAGTPKDIESINAVFDAPPGLEIRASLARILYDLITQAVPSLPKFENLKDGPMLLKFDAYIPVQEANLQFKTVEKNEIFSQIVIKVPDLLLNLDVTMPIKFDGTMKSLLRRALIFSK